MERQGLDMRVTVLFFFSAATHLICCGCSSLGNSTESQEQDSLSTQSTGQSYPEVASARDGGNETHGKLVGGHAKLASLLGTQDYVFPPSQVDYSKSIIMTPFLTAKLAGQYVAVDAAGLLNSTLQ